MTYAILLAEVAFVASVLVFGDPISGQHETPPALPQAVSNGPNHLTTPVKQHCRFHFGCAPMAGIAANSTRIE